MFQSFESLQTNMWSFIATFLAKVGSYAAAIFAGFELHQNLMPSDQQVNNELIQEIGKAIIEAKAEINDAKLIIGNEGAELLLIIVAVIILVYLLFGICVKFIAAVRKDASDKDKSSLQA